MTEEKKIQNSVMKWLKTLVKCKAMSITPGIYMEAGTPDILVALQGKGIFFEVKVPGKSPELIQSKRLKEWKDAGFITGWGTSLKEFQLFINIHFDVEVEK